MARTLLRSGACRPEDAARAGLRRLGARRLGVNPPARREFTGTAARLPWRRPTGRAGNASGRPSPVVLTTPPARAGGPEAGRSALGATERGGRIRAGHRP